MRATSNLSRPPLQPTAARRPPFRDRCTFPKRPVSSQHWRTTYPLGACVQGAAHLTPHRYVQCTQDDMLSVLHTCDECQCTPFHRRQPLADTAQGFSYVTTTNTSNPVRSKSGSPYPGDYQLTSGHPHSQPVWFSSILKLIQEQISSRLLSRSPEINCPCLVYILK